MKDQLNSVSAAKLVLGVKRLTPHSVIPTYGSEDAAGADLYADLSEQDVGTYVLRPGERRLFKTGISVSIPEGHYGRIAPRSGLAYKDGIDVMAGVVDRDYTGNVGVILINHGDDPKLINHGDRIAQFIVTAYAACQIAEVDSLEETNRASGGFGSTGA